MATKRLQIEHLERFVKNTDKPWKDLSESRKWLKKQMAKYIRRQAKTITDEMGVKTNKRPYKGWEY